MPLDLLDAFFVDEALVNRFNARRELTLGQTTPKTFDPEAASHYEPPAAGGSLETVIAEQMALDHRPGASTAMPEARC